ncbi:conserved oligomeric Golgi complex subunit 4-like isoform X2 [Ruditapes philippinarum]|uniref:conserved oligomeric Golgi complex subunit 4-like isoform X2 n=1 Tax=Ruditapes philippinarum TaxID=129788 RepID=UPI00295BE129|nr:conserved oligomeric Golgi complex subunit 4-like isoform X2 [Ruditapes philippinarum]
MATTRTDATSETDFDKIQSLTDVTEMQRALEKLNNEEDFINNDLSHLLERQANLEDKMLTLHRTLPNLQMLQTDSKQLSSMVSFTSTLAENVSSKVRQLDLAKNRVTACIQRVEDILDLKYCTDGVQQALQNEDYEKAAGHIHRFRSLDENVLRMSEMASEGMSSSSLDTSFKLLHESEEKLRVIVNSKFDASVHSRDVASIERFFKIFPLLGMYEEGLTKFGKYLAAKLSEDADKSLKLALHGVDPDDRRSSVVFADTITKLFEDIARIVEIHQPLVETYYGAGKLIMLLSILQKECDRQTRKLVKEFRNKRDFDQRVQQVKQSLMFHKQPTAEKPDSKDLDVLLSEVVLLNTRAELYLRFVKRRLMGDFEAAFQDSETREEKEKEVDKFIQDCDTSRVMMDLIGNYILMEEYFMREMVLKAVAMDSIDTGTPTSSMVDDSFFIVKKCVRRAMSSSSVDGVCAMLNHACTILEQDFREVLYSRVRAGFPSGFDLTQAYNMVIQQGKSTDTEKAKTQFITTLNNAEVSCDYCKQLKANLEDEVAKLYTQCSEQSKAKLESCLTDIGASATRFKDVVEFGFTQLTTAVIKPRLKPQIDIFLSTSHNISDDDYTNFEANDPWVQNFIVSLDSMLGNFKESLTSNNYEKFVSLITGEITTSLEKAVLKSAFNRLGGLQFDKELRVLVGYLTSVTTWTIRDKFARLTQMATVLNLEKVDELLDYWGPNSGPLTWRLTPSEVRQVLSLRIDFRTDEIKRLKL